MSGSAAIVQDQPAVVREPDSGVLFAIRRRIIAAAKHKFARFGYEGTRFADVARSADISATELSLHFESKLDILIAVFNAGWSEINQRLADIVLASVNAREAAFSMLALMMRVLEKDEDLARLLLFEGRRPNPESGEIELSEGYRKFERLCLELAARGQKDGSFSATLNSRAIACILTGAVESLMRQQLIGELSRGMAPFTAAEILSSFDMLVTGMKPTGY